MIRAALILWFALTATIAAAQDSAGACPDFYRFVDFGQLDAEGGLHAGGPLLRVEGFDGAALLKWDVMVCVDLPHLRRDGRGNLIPVVDTVVYDPPALPVDVFALEVSRVPDAVRMANPSAHPRAAVLADATFETFRGDTFLCGYDLGPDSLVCLFALPSSGSAPIVVTCDAVVCSSPGIPFAPHLLIRAAWPSPPGLFDTPSETAPAIGVALQDIYEFMRTLMG